MAGRSAPVRRWPIAFHPSEGAPESPLSSFSGAARTPAGGTTWARFADDQVGGLWSFASDHEAPAYGCGIRPASLTGQAAVATTAATCRPSLRVEWSNSVAIGAFAGSANAGNDGRHWRGRVAERFKAAVLKTARGF